MPPDTETERERSARMANLFGRAQTPQEEYCNLQTTADWSVVFMAAQKTGRQRGECKGGGVFCGVEGCWLTRCSVSCTVRYSRLVAVR